jgi:hypothetical protein
VKLTVEPRKPNDAQAPAVHRPRVETFGLPRGVFYLVMLVPVVPILGVGGYLLYPYPRPPLIAVPFVLAFGIIGTVAAARHWPTGLAHHRAMMIPSYTGYAYAYEAVGWEAAHWAAVIPITIGVVLILVYLVASGEPDPEAMALRPVERDPDDWRWTSPS